MTKSIWWSRTFWVALISALVGLGLTVAQALGESGTAVPPWVLVVLGAVSAWLRSDTRGAVYLVAPKQGDAPTEAGEAEETAP